MNSSITSTGAKYAFCHFNEMDLTDVLHYGLMGDILHKSNDHSPWSKMLMKQLALEVYEHPRLDERVSKMTHSNVTKIWVRVKQEFSFQKNGQSKYRQRPTIDSFLNANIFVVT